MLFAPSVEISLPRLPARLPTCIQKIADSLLSPYRFSFAFRKLIVQHVFLKFLASLLGWLGKNTRIPATIITGTTC